MSRGEDELIRGLAQTLGISETEAAELFQRKKRRFLLNYERLKRRFPEIAELEQREAEHIRDRAARRQLPEHEAAASFMMEKLEFERFRRKKSKITQDQLQEIVGDASIPQDVLDFIEGLPDTP